MNKTDIDKIVNELEKGIRPTMKFDKANQYGNYIRQTDGSNESFKLSKTQLMKRVRKFIPKEFRHLVVWIKHHWEAYTIKVKDDNYEMFGLTKDKIGTRFTVPEHWTLGWKYTPESMRRKTLDCDKLVKAKCDCGEYGCRECHNRKDMKMLDEAKS